MTYSECFSNLKKIGTLKNLKSSEIKDSGISVGLECLDREIFDFDRAYPHLFSTGAKYARIQTGWNRCEKEKGVYTFEWLDHIVDTLLAGGVQPWFNLGFGNPVYMENIPNPYGVGCVPLYFGEECLEAWKNFVSALAEHYCGRIIHWEIWNEPNVEHFWYPHEVNAEEYAKLIAITAPLIREKISDAKIGGCSGFARPDYDWQLQFFKTDAAKYLDFYAIHQYKIIPELQWDMNIAAWKRAFAKAGKPDIEIWQGEAGFPSWAPASHWIGMYRTNERCQAKWLLRRLLCDLGNGCAKSSFFQMVDMSAKPYQMASKIQDGSKVARHGLVDGFEYKPKMSHASLSHFTAVFDCDTIRQPYFCWPETDKILPKTAQCSKLLEPAIYIRTFERNGYPLYVYYLPEDIQLDAKYNGLNLAVIMDEGPKKLEQPILIDMLSGNVYDAAITSEVWQDKKFANLQTNLPLTDYPLVVTDLRALEERIMEQD